MIFSLIQDKPQSVKSIENAVITLDSNILTYNGSRQAKNVTSVVLSSTLTEGIDYIVTDNTGTNAGTYTLSILGIGQYTGIAQTTFTINKATPSISIDPVSLEVDERDTATVTVTTNSDGQITAISSDTNTCTVSVSGNVVTVEGIAEGEATVSVSVAAGTNYDASSTVTCSIEVQEGIPSVLSDATPEQIQAAYRKGVASTLWSVGDLTSAITISSSSSLPSFTPPSSGVQAYILGFDHNSSKEGNGIHFQFGKISGNNIAFIDSGYNSQKTSGTWFAINNSQSNSGGWASSRMRTVICPAFLGCMPSDWQNVISNVTKYSDNTGGGSDTSSYVTSTADKIFLLAEYEVTGTRTYANSAEQNKQSQYEYYANGNSKIKYRHNATSTSCVWTLRSARASSSTTWTNVTTDGGLNAYYANYAYGFAPGFVIS